MQTIQLHQKTFTLQSAIGYTDNLITRVSIINNLVFVNN